jgi:hypothetical protein
MKRPGGGEMATSRLILVLVLALGACGEKKEEGAAKEGSGEMAAKPAGEGEKAAAVKIVASCDHGMSVCTDHVDEATSKEECREGMDGTLKSTPCPTAGVVGSCTLPKGQIRRYYSTGESPAEPAYAEGHCKNAMGGKFEAAK